MRAVHARALHQPLQDAGLVPPNCRLMDVRIEVDGAIVVVYEAFLDAEQLITLGRILAEAGEKVLSIDPN